MLRSYCIEENFDFTLGLPEGITSIVHLCCGYPTYVDQNDYMKADKTLYIKLVSERIKQKVYKSKQISYISKQIAYKSKQIAYKNKQIAYKSKQISYKSKQISYKSK